MHASEEEQIQQFYRTRPPRRSNQRREVNTETRIKEIKRKFVDEIQLAQCSMSGFVATGVIKVSVLLSGS
jgi:hypothetical protein